MAASTGYEEGRRRHHGSLIARARSGDTHGLFILLAGVGPVILQINRITVEELESLVLDTFSRVMIEAYSGDFVSLGNVIQFFDVVESNQVINPNLLSDIGYDKRTIVRRSLEYGITICQNSDEILLETVEALFEYNGFLTINMRVARAELCVRCKDVIANMMQNLLDLWKKDEQNTPEFNQQCTRLLNIAHSRSFDWEDVGPGFNPRLWKAFQEHHDQQAFR